MLAEGHAVAGVSANRSYLMVGRVANTTTTTTVKKSRTANGGRIIRGKKSIYCTSIIQHQCTYTHSGTLAGGSHQFRNRLPSGAVLKCASLLLCAQLLASVPYHHRPSAVITFECACIVQLCVSSGVLDLLSHRRHRHAPKPASPIEKKTEHTRTLSGGLKRFDRGALRYRTCAHGATTGSRKPRQ